MTTQAVSSSIDEQANPLACAGAPPLALPALRPSVLAETHGLPAETVAVDQHRQNNFDFLRFLLAGLVIYSHSFLLCLGHNSAYGQTEPFSRLSGGKLSGGEIAVDAFFVISGFLIVQSWLRSESLWSYLRKRVARIYPAFVVSAALCLLIVCSLSPQCSRAMLTPSALLRYAGSTLTLGCTHLPGAFPHNPVAEANGSTWTILPEFLCYLMVAFLGWLGTFRRPILLLGITSGCVILFGIQQTGHPRLLDTKAELSWLPLAHVGHWLRLLSFFLLGMCFHFYRERIRFPRAAVLAAVVLLGGALLLKHGIFLALPSCGVYLLFCFAITRIGGLNHFGRYGDFSYGMYLYGYPVQQTLVALWKTFLTPYSLFLLALPLSCLLAFASWHWVEKPFLQRKPR